MAGVAASLLLAAAPEAHGQVAAPAPVPDLTQPAPAPETIGVGERPHPDYDPLGVRLGSFILKPAAEIGEIVASNIYGTSADERSDQITVATLGADLVSDWNNHAIGLHAEGDLMQYARYTSENIGNIILQANGRLDVTRGQYLELGAGYQLLHEDRTSPDSVAAAERAGGGEFARYPTEYEVKSAALDYVYSPRRIGVELDARITSLAFSNEPTLNGGTAINTDRNRTSYALTPKLSYEIVPGYQAFVEATGDRHEYDDTHGIAPDYFQRSSSGVAAAVGSAFKIGGLVTGTAYVGYQDRFYDDRRLGDTGGAYFGGSALWNATQLTSLRLSASRAIEETSLFGSSGFWDTQVELKLEHELLRNLLLAATASLVESDYQGIDLVNDDVGAGLSARWKLDRTCSVDVGASWLERSSTRPNNGFTQLQFLVGIKLQL